MNKIDSKRIFYFVTNACQTIYMFNNPTPTPSNEQDRLNSLTELDIDYLDLHDKFKDLARLAAKIAGTEISMINLIDSFTQWTVSNYGLTLEQMPKDESVCQYTITKDSYFEVPDLSADERFKDKFYVTGPAQLKYYLGIPLTTKDGNHIGALCVIDSTLKALSPEKIELLKLVASEIMSRFYFLKTIDSLKHELTVSQEIQKKISHDIRGPIAGIIGLTTLIHEQGESNKMNEVLECMQLIRKSGASILTVTDEILNGDRPVNLKADTLNLRLFKNKLERLYLTQAVNKKIKLLISINERNSQLLFLKSKLLQITGNLITNALKVTPENGTIEVDLDLIVEATNNLLKITIQTPSIPEDKEKNYEQRQSTVKKLVESIHGQFNTICHTGKGPLTEVILKQYYMS
jgi:hypothetical protein